MFVGGFGIGGCRFGDLCVWVCSLGFAVSGFWVTGLDGSLMRGSVVGLGFLWWFVATIQQVCCCVGLALVIAFWVLDLWFRLRGFGVRVWLVGFPVVWFSWVGCCLGCCVAFVCC